LKFAIPMAPSVIPPKVRDDLAPILGKYIK
jgi:hypothetical protein